MTPGTNHIIDNPRYAKTQREHMGHAPASRRVMPRSATMTANIPANPLNCSDIVPFKHRLMGCRT